MSGKKPKKCKGCTLRDKGIKLRDDRIALLEQLVTLHQSEPMRRATVEVQSNMMVANAHELQQQQQKLDEVKPDVDP